MPKFKALLTSTGWHIFTKFAQVLAYCKADLRCVKCNKVKDKLTCEMGTANWICEDCDART